MNTPRALTSSGGTAKTLILIGLVFQVLVGIVFLFGLGLLVLLTASFTLMTGVLGFSYFLALVWIGFGLIDFIFIFLVYTFSYRQTSRGYYQEASLPTLIVGILSLIFGGVITGILYILAYVKLRDAIQEQQQMTFRGFPAYPQGLPPTPPPPPPPPS